MMFFFSYKKFEMSRKPVGLRLKTDTYLLLFRYFLTRNNRNNQITHFSGALNLH